MLVRGNDTYLIDAGDGAAFSTGYTDPELVDGYVQQVRTAYDGEVVIANDLDRF